MRSHGPNATCNMLTCNGSPPSKRVDPKPSGVKELPALGTCFFVRISSHQQPSPEMLKNERNVTLCFQAM
jgi:hypothetical protein